MRSDARRNRERLVAAAREAFASGEPKVSLDSVARAARVGIGTLYRHFPTREALAEAVYQTEFAALRDSAAELLAELPPDAALRAWMARFGEYVATKREMAEALRAVIATIPLSAKRAELAEAARTVLEAGAADGSLRPDVLPEDVVAAVVGIHLATPDDPEQAARILDLFMDALRP
ncbi:TetR family transcriptional regulator [Saccharopolyspora sp. TS4A08]|uniref:TetR family transcriptional regulator n=1 Tax=Saccharopolyspora ipomoeae TaxID=3042027 RepID=A0ABT6PPI4_9PSEU|nr:TetR family transcriptional regulator [Saccharopolyspora sp. TS4A08]MDI2029900.1 TetR family transcriptional regulator [Saccharopolyspora sp. TS4A08]